MKLAILSIDAEDYELEHLRNGLENFGNSTGYKFLITNHDIKSIDPVKLLSDVLYKRDHG